MSRYSNKSNIRVNGNGNHIGDSLIDNRREYHQHHHVKSENRNSDDKKGEGFAILFMALTIIWFFSKYAYEIYGYIKLAALISMTPFIIVIAINFIWREGGNKESYAAIFGLLTNITMVMLAEFGVNNLDPRLVEMGQQAKNGWDFWNSLNEYGHQLILGSMAGAVFIGVAVVISLLMGVYLCWSEYDDSDYVPRVLRPFRPNLAAVLISIFLVLSWLFMSGNIFQLIK